MAKRKKLGALGAGLMAAGQQGMILQQQREQRKAVDDRATAGQTATQNRQLMLSTINDVQAGKVDPAQAEATLQAFGVNVPAGALERLGPSQDNRMADLLGTITKAGSISDVPSDRTLGQMGKAKRLPLLGFGALPEAPAQPNTDELPSSPMGPTSSPQMQQLFDAAKDKRRAIPGTKMGRVDPATGAEFEDIIPAAEMGQPRTVQTGLSAAQQGGLKATAAGAEMQGRQAQGVDRMEGAGKAEAELAKLAGENAGGAPQLRGQADLQQAKAGALSPEMTGLKGAQENALENLTRGPKVQTAAAMSGATAQAAANVHNDPENIRKEAAGKLAIEQALDEYHVPPELKADLLNDATGKGSITGTPYAVIDKTAMPPEFQKAIAKGAVAAGIKVIGQKDQQALREISNAKEGLYKMLDLYGPTAAGSPTARGVTGPANRIAAYLQTNPQLATADSLFGPTISVLKGSMGGTTNMRISDLEIKMAKAQMPNASDTKAVAAGKVGALVDIMEQLELGILRPNR